MRNGGFRGNRAGDILGLRDEISIFTESDLTIPKIDYLAITDGSYTDLGIQAVSLSGGEYVLLNGSGFTPNLTARLGSTIIGSITYFSPTQVAFLAPSLSEGIYTLLIHNDTGGCAIYIPGVKYSQGVAFGGVSGELGIAYESVALNRSLNPSSDSPITYTLLSGALPEGTSINQADGSITGIAPITGGQQTYTFTIKATDAEGQFTVRTFNLTISEDIVNWVYPTDGTNLDVIGGGFSANLESYSSSGRSIIYSSNNLPAGITINGSTLAGVATTSSDIIYTGQITATTTVTNRSATIYVVWNIITGDPFWPRTTLAIASESNILPFISNLGTSTVEILATNEVTPTKFTPFMGNYYSVYFNGASYLQLPTATTFTVGTNNFTIECWAYLTVAQSSGSRHFCDGTSNNQLFLKMNTTNICIGRTGVAEDTIFNYSFAIGQWYHIAFCRFTGVVYAFVNGASIGSAANTVSYAGGGYYIGAAGGSQYWNGYISNFRLMNGIAKYTAPFTPPTVPFTAEADTSFLMCQHPRLIETGILNHTVTRSSFPTVSPHHPFPSTAWSTTELGSAYFDGSGDNVTFPTVFPSTTQWTIEAWVFLINGTNTQTLINFNPHQTIGISMNRSGGEDTYVYLGNGSSWLATPAIASSTNFALNAWNHISLVRDGATITLYHNGVSVGTTSVIPSGFTGGGKIGEIVQGGEPVKGFISNWRMVNGSAIVPPVGGPLTPLTTVTNTSLFTFVHNGPTNNKGIRDDGPLQLPITNSNVHQTSISGTQVNGWSMYFASHYLISSAPATITTGEFSIEFWINPDSFSGSPMIIGNSNWDIGQNSGWRVYANTTGKIGLDISSGTFNVFPNVLTSISSLTLNVWQHVLITRNTSNIVRCFINGVDAGGSVTYAASLDLRSSGTGPTTRIAYVVADGGVYQVYTGYLSNIRVENGTGCCLYPTASSFTPPTSPLVAGRNTIFLMNSGTYEESGPQNSTITYPTGNPFILSWSPFSGSRTIPAMYNTNFVSGAYVIVPIDNNLHILATDFTIECWVYFASVTGVRPIAAQWRQTTGQGGWTLNSSGTTLQFNWGAASEVSPLITGSATLVANRWYHIAVVKINPTFTMYLNGQSIGSAGSGATRNTMLSVNITFGDYYSSGGTLPASGSSGFLGNIANFRMVKGLGVYTGNFTVPTAPLTLTQSAGTNIQAITTGSTSLLIFNTFQVADESTSSRVITTIGAPRVLPASLFGVTTATVQQYRSETVGGSGFFSSAYVETGYSTLQLAIPGDFTIEGWAYRTDTAGNQTIFELGTYQNGILFRPSGSDSLYINNTNYGDVSAYLRLHVWMHWAVQRRGTAVIVFINGIPRLYATVSGTINTGGDPLRVGASRHTGGQIFYGYIGNVRFSNGTAVYQGPFSPPLTPPTVTTSTVHMFNFANGAIIDQTSKHAVRAEGNAKRSTAIKKFGNSSMYFDGTGDWLLINPTHQINGNITRLLGNFTIEFWVYAVAWSGQMGMITITNTSSSGSSGIAIYFDTGNKIAFWVNGNSSPTQTTSTYTTSTWYHIALVRNVSTNTLYVNGIASASNSTTPGTNNTQAIGVGRLYNDNTSFSLNGYIDDLRITNGVARYTTSTYVVPTAEIRLR